MTKLGLLGVAVAALVALAPDAMAQRRGGGGGAARSGTRGAVVGGMVGGSEGAKKGAKAGVVVGATRGVAERTADRNAVDSESQSRTEYESTAEYQSAQHSDFSEAPPELLTSPSDKSATPGGDAIITKDGKPIVAITYPSGWKQKESDDSVSAVSKEGNAWSALALLDGVKDKQAGIKKIKQAIEKYLKDVEYDDLTKTDRGALLITGTGKGKKAGTDVVFSAAVFEAAPGQLAGVAFIVDKSVDDRYKEAARYIVKTIRVEKDLAGQQREVAKPVSN
jgi:transcription termination factor NusB